MTSSQGQSVAWMTSQVYAFNANPSLLIAQRKWMTKIISKVSSGAYQIGWCFALLFFYDLGRLC